METQVQDRVAETVPEVATGVATVSEFDPTAWVTRKDLTEAAGASGTTVMRVQTAGRLVPPAVYVPRTLFGGHGGGHLMGIWPKDAMPSLVAAIRKWIAEAKAAAQARALVAARSKLATATKAVAPVRSGRRCALNVVGLAKVVRCHRSTIERMIRTGVLPRTTMRGKIATSQRAVNYWQLTKEERREYIALARDSLSVSHGRRSWKATATKAVPARQVPVRVDHGRVELLQIAAAVIDGRASLSAFETALNRHRSGIEAARQLAETKRAEADEADRIYRALCGEQG